MSTDPFNTQGDPSHPGLTGGPFNPTHRGGPRPEHQPNTPHIDDVPLKDMDALGTGTYPPDQQGVENKAQPQGISAQNQYGVPSPGQVQGESPVPSPVTSPLPPPPSEEESESEENLDSEEETEEEVDSEEEPNPYLHGEPRKACHPIL